MRRGYGSDVPGLIDAPLNGQTLVRVYAAIAEALDRWEPRVTLERIEIGTVTEAGVEVRLSGIWTDRAADAGTVIDGAHAQAGPVEVAL
jgi:phage baseplate assembly protein W